MMCKLELRARLSILKMIQRTPSPVYVQFFLRCILLSFNFIFANKGCCSLFLQASVAEHGIWKMTFYTPQPVVMVLREAEQAGYSARTTSNRLVMRSPYNTAETYSEDVSSTPLPSSLFLLRK